FFQVEDEVGYLYDLYDVPVTAFAAGLEMMARSGLRLRWASIPGRSYEVYGTERLDGAWDRLSTVTALEEETCLDVPINPSRKTGFFKIVMLDDSAE
ncbi:MAG: hypothetical protein WCK89_19365, partial [bacterium]